MSPHRICIHYNFLTTKFSSETISNKMTNLFFDISIYNFWSLWNKIKYFRKSSEDMGVSF